MINDPISDILTRIRNANIIKHQRVLIPKTKLSYSILTILKKEGFIQKFINYDDNYLSVSLKYIGKKRKHVITKLQRISKPGSRIYTNSKKLPKILGNLGIAIISTSKGIMTNIKAKKLGIGGEVLCYIW